jgi:hypothetical protein
MQRPRTPSKLSESLHRRLNSYALAASAAGVATLALANPAEAKIVYTKAHQQIPPNTQFNLDLNHDNITDFTLSNTYGFVSTFSVGGALAIVNASGNEVMGYCTSTCRDYAFASALPAGMKIQLNRKFKAKNKLFMVGSFRVPTSTGFEGQWWNVKNRYLGLQFAITGKTHYGWARLNVSCASYKCTGLLTGYAYETMANKSIIAGKTHGKDVITVEPATLGHLAQGASGFSAWRRRVAATR